MNGWTCPKCGKVYAPDVKECAGCNAKTWPVFAPLPEYPVHPIYIWPNQYYVPVYYKVTC